MGQRSLAGRAALIASLLCGTAVQAQVTPEEVWTSWTDYYASMGQTITTGSEARDGDTLVVTDAKIASEVPDGSFSIAFGEVRLKDLGDGRVEVTFAPTIPITVVGKTPEGQATNMVMNLSHTGMTMIASGTPDNTAYDFTAPEMKLGMGEMTVDGTAVPMTLDVTMTNNSGKYQMTAGTERALVSQFASDKITFNVSGQDPESQGTFAMTGDYSGITGTSNATLPEAMDMNDMNAALRAGFKADGSFAYTGGSYKVDVTDPTSGPMNISMTDQGGNLTFAMSQEQGLSYGGGSKGLAANVTGGQVPMPLDFSMAEAAFNFAMPVVQSDTAQPVAVLVRMIDVSLSEGIWSMFDPTSQLPRDPATIVVDVTGMGKWGFDILDPAMQEPGATPPAVPGEMESVTLNQLQVKAVGAELTGTGQATFDNSTGTPMPIGAVDLKLTGANALIDKLVAMGILPEDQAMGARMMMGMFAVPAGDDVLTSKIEFKEGGSIFANGQQIQ